MGYAVATVIADPGAGYAVLLMPGTCVIGIHHQGIGGSRVLPAIVTIRSGEMARRNSPIDNRDPLSINP